MEQKDYGLSVWVSMSSTLPLLKVSLQPHFRFKLQPRSLLPCLLISRLVGSSSRPLITSCHPSKSFKGSHYFHGMESSACLSKLSTAFLSISSGPFFPLPRRPSLIRLHQPPPHSPQPDHTLCTSIHVLERALSWPWHLSRPHPMFKGTSSPASPETLLPYTPSKVSPLCHHISIHSQHPTK